MKTSQKDKVLTELRSQGFVTRNWALRNFISRLGAIMCDLKKDGIEFETKRIEGDYGYILQDKPKATEVYRVNGEIVGKKVIW